MAKHIQQFEKNSFQKTATRSSTILGVGLACMLAVVGCDRKKEDIPKETNNSESKDDIKNPNGSVDLVPVGADAEKVCADSSLTNGLKSSVKEAVVQQSKIYGKTHSQKANFDADLNIVAENAGKVLVDVKEVKAAKVAANNGMVTCQATVSMRLPTSDINNANSLYTKTNQNSLEQRLAQSNITLDNNQLIDDKFTFVVNPQSASPVAKIVGQPAMLQAAADVMASSALKSQIEKSASAPTKARSSSNGNASQQPLVITKPPVAKPRQTQQSLEAKKAAEKRAAEKRAAQRREAAKKRAAQKAAAEKKAAQERLAAKKAAEKKKSDKEAAERKRLAEKKAAEVAAKKEKAAEKKNLSLENDGVPKSPEAVQQDAAKAKAKASTKTQVEKKPEPNVNKVKTPVSNDIEMVIVEEEGTY